MTRFSLESGRIIALFSLYACTSGHVLEATGPRPAMSEVAPPMAAGGAGAELEPPQPSAAAMAGREALLMRSSQAQGGTLGQPPQALPEHVFGVTLTDVAPLESITAALADLAQKPTARIVFDVRRHAITYLPALREIHGVSYVMGELVDSVSVAGTSLDAYAARTTDYLNELSEHVDIWEIGNEVNGEWLGPSDKVQAKIIAAYWLVKERDQRTALTLYYNQGCVQSSEHEIFTWAQSNIPKDMRQGLDYVWVSYYEQRCHSGEPDWNHVFSRLHELFPHAKLGIGGCGTSEPAQKADLVRHFYSLDVDVSSFVGGYFYWYFREDMLPSKTPLWTVLNDTWLRSPL
jgi:hypothetical protein